MIGTAPEISHLMDRLEDSGFPAAELSKASIEGQPVVIFTHLLDLTAMPLICLRATQSLIGAVATVKAISPVDGPLREFFEKLGVEVSIKPGQRAVCRK